MGRRRTRVRRPLARVAVTRRATSATCCCRFCTSCRRASAGSASRALGYVCRRLTIPPAEAYGVASFYALFALEPRPPRVAHICTDIACMCRGSAELVEQLEQTVGPAGQPSADGTTTWLESPCLGMCEQAPAALVTIAGEERATIAIGSATVAAVAAALAGVGSTAGRRAAREATCGCFAGSATSTRRASTAIATRAATTRCGARSSWGRPA